MTKTENALDEAITQIQNRKKLTWQKNRRKEYIANGQCPEHPSILISKGHKHCSFCLRKKKADGFIDRFLLKLETIDAYGGVCSCCGEYRPEFLTLDHLNNDGQKHKKELKVGTEVLFYSWLKKQGYPQNLSLAVRCFNCNCARSSYGICPHEEEKKQ